MRVYSGGADVCVGGEVHRASLRKRLLAGRRRAKHVLAPGDLVEVGQDGAETTIESILDRRNRISRESAGGRYEQVLYANVDCLVVVGSVREPPLRPGLFDRFLVAAEREGIAAVLVANKADLGIPEDAEVVAEVYRELGYPTVFTSVPAERGLDELLAALPASGLIVFAGHSGVGKSSLLNRIYPGFFTQATKEISRKYGRGRHTTTQTLLHEIEPGRFVADTPGVRAFAFYDNQPDEIGFAFREMAPLIPSCRFKGCTHTHEPGCAVKAAVSEGAVSEMRYRSYLRLIEEDIDDFEEEDDDS